MAFVLGRLLAAPLLLLNFALYVAVAAIAGWALNLAIDDTWEAVTDNPVTFYFVIFALIAGVVGIASKIAGTHHLFTWQTEGIAGTYAAASIAWLLTLLAMGLAVKEITWGGARYLSMKFLEAFVIILAVTQLFYLLALRISAFTWRFGRRRQAFEDQPPPPVSKEGVAAS